jgi:clan AA aspartic protease
MNGVVDDQRRALLRLPVHQSFGNPSVEIEAWVDTAFDGHFVFSSGLIKELSLETLVETEAILADGSKVVLQTYVCYLTWFGEKVAAQVVENEGRFPLLGTTLLDQRELSIDYAGRTLKLS